MKNKIENGKGEIMLNRAENQFWAYNQSNDTDENDLVLLDNVQFIYELSLAEMELKAFNVQYDTMNGLREFKLLSYSDEITKRIKKRSSYFKTICGQKTDYFYIINKNRTRSVNQYLTHWIYPYKGKFHPQMIRALINIIGLKPGDTVFEPFSGSGTTALESQLLGINFKGIDVSPLCVIQGLVKTRSLFVIDEILKIKDDIISNLSPNLFQKEENYYNLLENIAVNDDVKNFYIMSRLLAVSDNSRRKRNYQNAFLKNLEQMINSVQDFVQVIKDLNLQLGNVENTVGDSRNIDLPDNSIDGIITSPPYSIALDYVQNDAHSLVDLGHNIGEIRDDFIGVRGTGKKRVELYNDDMKASYSEMHRILKSGKYAVIVIGDATYNGNRVKTVDFTIEYMTKLGFQLKHNINKIIFGLYNIMKKENVLIFKKEQ